jgi:hypothetical protein
MLIDDYDLPPDDGVSTAGAWLLLALAYLCLCLIVGGLVWVL